LVRSKSAGGKSSIRLAGGSSSSDGRVEVLHDKVWGTVCDDGFDDTDAHVVCKQMGLSGGTHQQSFGGGSGKIWMDNLACSGSESKLKDCPRNDWGEHNCGHHEDVGVSCEGTLSKDIRLVGGQNSKSGRMEVLHDGEWGTVCDDSFDSNDAKVVCRQLDFSGGSQHQSAYFGQGSGTILMDDVQCTGSEQQLKDCPFASSSTWGSHDCGHGEDVGVTCD
jgi:hypothetical protein